MGRIARRLYRKDESIRRVILNEAGVLAGRVANVAEIVRDSQVAIRGFFKEFTASECGLNKGIKVPLAAYKFKTGGPRVETPPPRVGANTDEMLSSIGYHDSEIQILRENGIV
ncbi:MAG TPA: CoA transferase [Eoetvoesiella sp.]